MKIFYTEKHLQHDPGSMTVYGIPYVSEEAPERIEIIRRAVAAAGIGPFAPATDHGLAPIQAVHTPGFLDFLQRASARQSASQPGPLLGETFACRPVRHHTRHLAGLAGYYGFGTGSPIDGFTWEAAYWSAQCALTAADALLAGAHSAYALCRPPGHHAAADLFGGFCYLNNAAIAARYLQQRRSQPPGAADAAVEYHSPVAILDIDYHHGNGTQEIFYQDRWVLYASLHAHPDDEYPYFWGGEEETGEGAGAGCNRNWTLPQQCDDGTYLRTLDQALADIYEYAPDVLVVSLGVDTAEGDMVGGFRLTQAAFQAIGQRIGRTAQSLLAPLLIVQEGGYRLDTLGQSVVVFLQGVMEEIQS